MLVANKWLAEAQRLKQTAAFVLFFCSWFLLLLTPSSFFPCLCLFSGQLYCVRCLDSSREREAGCVDM